jgi:VIT1/CCC1 family predicted Fe2+/Mn2+ transporter
MTGGITKTLNRRWVKASEEERMLRVVQPGLLGLTDGTLSTLAPIFAAAYIAGSRAALLVGLSAALGAAISMGVSEALSDDGKLTGRGSSVARGVVTGVATFVGGAFHSLPFVISNVHVALAIAYCVVGTELIAIAWVRKRFLRMPLSGSLIQVTLAGIVIAGAGFLVGHA